MLLFRDWFAVTKPLSQIQRSTHWPPQDTDPTPSLGGFGLNLRVSTELGQLQPVAEGTLTRDMHIDNRPPSNSLPKATRGLASGFRSHLKSTERFPKIVSTHWTGRTSIHLSSDSVVWALQCVNHMTDNSLVDDVVRALTPSQRRRGSDPRPAAATSLGPRKPGDLQPPPTKRRVGFRMAKPEDSGPRRVVTDLVL